MYDNIVFIYSTLVSDIIPSKYDTTANVLGPIIGYALGYGIAYNSKLGRGLHHYVQY